MRRLRASALAFALLAAACSLPSDDYVRADAVRLARSHFQGQNLQYFDVVSAGVGRDTIFVWMSALGFTSDAEERLARTLRASGPGRLNVCVAGPVPAKTYQIVKGALQLSRGLELDHVHLLVLGRNGDRRALEEAAVGAGVHVTLMPVSVLGKARPAPR